MVPLDIVVEDDLDVGPRYILEPLTEVWRSAGRRVTIRRVGEPQRADLAILHVNRSIIPERLAAVARQYSVCLNADAVDLSKRAVSTMLVAIDDAYTGPVIVKTDANAGGAPDARKARLYGGQTRAQHIFRELGRLLPWQLAHRLPRHEYPIFSDKSAVPDWMWAREDLIVERLAVERSEYGYVTRRWTFLGPAEWCAVCHAKSPVVKRDNTVKLERSDFIPESARSVRKRLRCDYGKIDFAITDKGPVVFDVNATPTFSAMNDILSAMVEILSTGLPG
jgi:hypothetical protein